MLPSTPPHIYITSDDTTFDPSILTSLTAESLPPTYLSHTSSRKDYLTTLRHLSDDLELGEKYAILAYGAAASECLDFYTKPQPGCVALIAYYPDKIPNPKTKYPSHLEVLCHLCAGQGFAPAFPSYIYQAVRPGFAESDLGEYDAVAASLAWSRTLAVLRKAFSISAESVGLEQTWEAYQSTRFITLSLIHI